MGLAAQNLNLVSHVFSRRNHKSRAKDRKWNSQRSHITFRAVKVLAENGLVEDGGRKRMLGQLFSHLEAEINRVSNTKQTLLEKIEAKVKELIVSGWSQQFGFCIRMHQG